MVKITYTNSMNKLKVLAMRGSLHTCNVSGRFGLTGNGDADTINTYTEPPVHKTASPDDNRR